MPPGWVPSERCTSKKPLTSSSTSSKRRVLWPLGAPEVLPGTGGHNPAPPGPPEGVAVHRVADPGHLVALRADLLDQRGQLLAHHAGAHPHHEGQPARLV